MPIGVIPRRRLLPLVALCLHACSRCTWGTGGGVNAYMRSGDTYVQTDGATERTGQGGRHAYMGTNTTTGNDKPVRRSCDSWLRDGRHQHRLGMRLLHHRRAAGAVGQPTSKGSVPLPVPYSHVHDWRARGGRLLPVVASCLCFRTGTICGPPSRVLCYHHLRLCRDRGLRVVCVSRFRYAALSSCSAREPLSRAPAAHCSAHAEQHAVLGWRDHRCLRTLAPRLACRVYGSVHLVVPRRDLRRPRAVASHYAVPVGSFSRTTHVRLLPEYTKLIDAGCLI